MLIAKKGLVDDSSDALIRGDWSVIDQSNTRCTTESELAKETKVEEMFRKLLKEKGFKIVEIRGDGNCLFRAVSHQMFLTEEHHGLLRKKCVEHLRGKIYHHYYNYH